ATVALKHGEEQEVVVVDPNHCAVHLRVIDPDGAPIPTAVAQVFRWLEEEERYYNVTAEQQADGQGRIQFSTWDSIEFFVSIAAPGYHPAKIDVQPYAIHGEVTVTLARSTRVVRVRIVDQQRTPLSVPVRL